MSDPKFDLVIFGATSFVGEITADYMLDKYGADGPVRWAVAGRSEAKLAKLKETLGSAANDLPTILANSDDEASLEAMCDQTRLVISTVGPYALYGDTLVKVCAASGTHYCDLTGETQWIAAMQEAHEDAAKKSGALIVHSCGFDSIPSDMGVHFLQEQISQEFGQTCEKVEMGVQAAKGGLSGGTAASLINVLKEAQADPSLRKKLADHYLLCPEGHCFTAKQEERARYYSDALESWCAPFVMAAINTRNVHRSNALQDNRYGANFRYSEYTMTGDGFKGSLGSIGMTVGMGAFIGVLALGPTRSLAEKFLLPKPGEGPSPEDQKNGFYKLLFAGTLPGGEVRRVRVTGDRDPGYGSTAKMLAEAALCILDTAEGGEAKGGFWTPSSLMGGALRKRLSENAGLTFEVVQ
ncbi:saccharopine dehydrogenase [Erythrobacter longus]|uniref:Saccharopine dehydrogenase n=1 Tax=Erythrobacter longus TaxID=1044 RepID=A0A074MY89_ERYLO|nr:saccharopine dehydrogenase NADP-binding domain-containing protein [Erythrobacter longus]KEO90572.1 saccharopine dehydrogenase [Erythrobacter longus]